MFIIIILLLLKFGEELPLNLMSCDCFTPLNAFGKTHLYVLLSKYNTTLLFNVLLHYF